MCSGVGVAAAGKVSCSPSQSITPIQLVGPRLFAEFPNPTSKNPRLIGLPSGNEELVPEKTAIVAIKKSPITDYRPTNCSTRHQSSARSIASFPDQIQTAKMPAPTALVKPTEAPEAITAPIQTQDDDELILDVPDSTLEEASAAQPPADPQDVEMAVDEEGRPKFAPGKDVVRIL